MENSIKETDRKMEGRAMVGITTINKLHLIFSPEPHYKIATKKKNKVGKMHFILLHVKT